MVTLALAAALLLLGPVGDAQAQSVQSLNERISRARAEARTQAAAVEATTAALASARERAAGSLEREARLTTLLAGGRETEADLARRTAAANERLRAARKRLGRAVTVLSERLVAIYKSGEVDSVSLLLSAEGYDDLLTRGEYLQRIEESDARLTFRVRALRNAVRVKAGALQASRDAARNLNTELAKARERISGVRATAEAQAKRAASARGLQAATLASLRSDVAEWTREVERIKEVSTLDAQGEVISWFGDWAIPQAIVMCESGGNYSALNPSSGASGAYQIIPSTWAAYGGKGLPHQASKTEQDRIAALIWRDSGPSAWVCAG